MIFKRIAAWIAYEIREEKITFSSQDAKRILMDVAPPVSPDVFSENRSREIRYAGYYGMGWGSTMILFVLGIVLFNKVERTFMDTI